MARGRDVNQNLACPESVDLNEFNDWLSRGKGSTHMFIVKDFTDGVIFPFYIATGQNPDVIRRYFISESKMKLIDIYAL